MLYHYHVESDVDAPRIGARLPLMLAKSIVEPADMFYGDRHACVRDVADNDWWIASRMEILSADEIQNRALEFYQKMAKPAPWIIPIDSQSLAARNKIHACDHEKRRVTCAVNRGQPMQSTPDPPIPGCEAPGRAHRTNPRCGSK